jgi:hypothetical protein
MEEFDKHEGSASRLTALSSGATPASRTEGERSETEVKAAGVVACSELLGALSNLTVSHAHPQSLRAFLS